MSAISAGALDRAILSFIREYSAAEASDRVFQELAFKIFAYQYQYNRIYRQFCDSSGVAPSKLKSWKQIPAMPADGFKELELISFPRHKIKKVFRTSGTTQDKRGVHAFETLKLYDAALLPVFDHYLLPDKKRMQYCFLIQSSKDAPDSSLSYMMSIVNKKHAGLKGKFYIGKNWADFGLLVRDLRYARMPVMLLATAFSLKAFLDYLENENIWLNLPAHSRLMETGGFKGRTQAVSKEVLYRLCGERLGISRSHCVSEYGMTELSSQAYDTTLRDHIQHKKRRFFKKGPAWMRTLVIDPKSGSEAPRGKKGLLRHFDLANRGSVLAVQTEDVGVQKEDGFEVLSRAKKAQLRGCSLSYEKFIHAR